MERNKDFSQKEERLNFCLDVAGEGIVLLKNEGNILPLENVRLAVFGATQLGAQAANEGVKVDTENSVGITEAFLKRGMVIDELLYKEYGEWQKRFVQRTYGEWRNAHVFPEPEITAEKALDAKKRGADTAVMVITRASYENSDMEIEVGDYIISETERNMIKNVCSVFENTVLILHIGCNIDLGFLSDFNIKGIIYTNHLGVNGNLSIADIMLGKINPSGKLPITLARHFEDYPSSANFGQHGGGLLQDYTEDIFVGYRYFESFEKQYEKVVFPFGFGLSYTLFEITDKTFKEENGTITVTASVKNTGNMAGKEVLQLYYSVPNKADGARLSGAEKQLCGFEKTRLLKPGETQEISISFKTYSMAVFDDTGVLGEKSVWVMENGEYKIMLGTDSHNTEIIGTHTEQDTRVTERCHEIITTLSERLTRSGKYEKLPQPNTGDGCHGISAIGKTEIKAESFNNAPEKFAGFHAGEGYTYSLLPGSGGAYGISFKELEMPNDKDENLCEIYVNNVKVKDLKSAKNYAEIILPLSRCSLKIIPFKDFNADSIAFEKVDSLNHIFADRLNSIDAANFYENDFFVTTANYNNGNGDSGSYVTNFDCVGRFVTYKLDVAEAGTYEIAFKYAYSCEEKAVNTVITVLASNIVQPLGGNLLKRTYSEGECKRFITSDRFAISLPQGKVYLKIAAENVPFPDISLIYLEKAECEITAADISLDDIRERNSQFQAIPRRKLIDDPANYPKKGIQLSEVYRDPELMKPFLEQLTNRELATIVSGTTNNLTPGGDVGCNSPLHERGVPAAQTADGPCGLRQFDQIPIAFPVGMVLSATFNKELFADYGLSMAEECLEYSVDYLLGPSINIIRNPAGGRNCSYHSEDPYLAGITAAYYIKALQSKGIAALLKHYTANSTEFERLKSNSRVSARALREIYLKAFEIAVKESDPWGMMSSYNHVNDKKVCEDYTLITEIPHIEWGWNGIFMTDWWNDSKHTEELKAGHDLKMSTGDIEGVTQALDSGELTREQVYVCAERVLKTLMKIGRIKNQFEKED